MASWGVAKLKAQLSEALHAAETDGPQVVSRSGRDVAVIVSLEEWKRLRENKRSTPEPGVGTLAEILMRSPLHGALKIPRTRLRKRELF